MSNRWTILPQEKPTAQQYYGLQTALAKRANFVIRKVDDYVERWPQLSLTKNIDLGTDLTVKLGLAYDSYAAGAEDNGNWTYHDDGETNLAIDSIAKNVGNDEVTITFAAEVLWPQLELSDVSIDDVDPVFSVVLSRDAFTSEALCEDVGNWTIDVGDTDLTVASITYVDATHCTIETTGTCAAGTFAVKVKAAALDGSLDSGVASYDTETETSTCTNIDHKSGYIRLMAKAAALDGSLDSGEIGFIASVTEPGGESVQLAPSILVTAGIDTADEDPILKIVVNNHVFLDRSACENIQNWDIDAEDVGLTVDHIECVNEREAWIHFSGTVAAGYLSIVTLPGLFLDDPEAVIGQAVFVDEAEWTGTYEQSVMAGDLHVYQFAPNDSLEAYLGMITPAQDDVASPVMLDLVDKLSFNPKLGSMYWYEADGAETGDFTLYGKLLLDI